MDAVEIRCTAHFHASASRCDLPAGHDGNHLSRGFAEWDEPLTHYPAIKATEQQLGFDFTEDEVRHYERAYASESQNSQENS